MRLARYLVLASLPCGFAFAEDGGKQTTPLPTAKATPVIGGAAAPDGKWPDAVALMFGGQQECTGTLVAPTVVITAGHCVNDGAPDQVLIGTSSLLRPGGEGELINVEKFVEYP